MSRRWWIADAALLAAGLALFLGWHEFFPWFLHLTGSDDESGPWYGFWSGFGSDFGEITTVISVLDMARRAARMHAQLLAQNARHHRERLAQAREHHAAHMALLGEHHRALKEHITATLGASSTNEGACP